MIDFGNLSRSEVEKLIDEYIFSERDRKILKRRLLDGIRYEPLPINTMAGGESKCVTNGLIHLKPSENGLFKTATLTV